MNRWGSSVPLSAGADSFADFATRVAAQRILAWTALDLLCLTCSNLLMNFKLVISVFYYFLNLMLVSNNTA